MFESIIAENGCQLRSPLIERLKIELFRSIFIDNNQIMNEHTIKSNAHHCRDSGHRIHSSSSSDCRSYKYFVNERQMSSPPIHFIPTKTFFELTPYFDGNNNTSKVSVQKNIKIDSNEKMKKMKIIQKLGKKHSLTELSFSAWKMYIKDIERKTIQLSKKIVSIFFCVKIYILIFFYRFKININLICAWFSLIFVIGEFTHSKRSISI